MLGATDINVVVNSSEALAKAGSQIIFPSSEPLVTKLITLTDGTGANKAQKIGVADFSLAAAASQTFDLTAFPGIVANVNFTLIKFLMAWHAGILAGDILDLGADGVITNPWVAPWLGTNPRSRIFSGAPVFLGSPVSGFVVDATHKNFAVKNNGAGTIAGSILVIGEGT